MTAARAPRALQLGALAALVSLPVALAAVISPAAALAQPPFVPSMPPPRLDAQGIDHALDPPDAPPRLGARLVTFAGLALATTGLVGSAVSPRCATRSANGDCVDVRGAHPVFPVTLVVGIALSIAGHWALRQDAPAAAGSLD